MTPQYLLVDNPTKTGIDSTGVVNALSLSERKEIFARLFDNPETPGAAFNIGYFAGLSWALKAASLEEMRYLTLEYDPYCGKYVSFGKVSDSFDVPDSFSDVLVTDILRPVIGVNSSIPVTIEIMQMEYGLVRAVMDTYQSCLRSRMNTIDTQLRQ
jgi:hypothetical protein